MLMYRDGKETPLAATPFFGNLSGVLVYYDEARTRGTDLQLPANAIAALTLGLGQNKDSTVQGEQDFCSISRCRH